MALYWSWAWGDETSTQLANEMGWSRSDTNTSRIGPRSDTVYTYPGSPTRYSLGTTGARYVQTPASTWLQSGWICIPIFATTGFSGNEAWNLVASYGNANSIQVYISNTTTGEVTLQLYDNTFSRTQISAGTITANDWHYIALKYDHSLLSPTAELWIDGSLRCAGTASWSEAQSTTGVYRSGGFASAGSLPSGQIGQIVVYDTGSLSSGNPYDPIYCTRVNPTVDETGVGTFSPSTGADNFAVLDSPFDSSIFTANTSSNVGDRVVCQSSGALGWYSQLGTTPTVINGLTTHVWASGSGQNGFAGVSNDNSTYDTGSHITPDTNDPTYGYVNSADQPSDAAPWNTGSLLYVKYEVS